MPLKTNLAVGFQLEEKQIYHSKHTTVCDGTQCCECLGYIETKYVFWNSVDEKKGVNAKPLLMFDRTKPELIEKQIKKMHVERRILNEKIFVNIPRKLFVDVDDANLYISYGHLAKSTDKKDWNEYLEHFKPVIAHVVYNMKEVIYENFLEEDNSMIIVQDIIDKEDFSYYYSNGWDEVENRFKASVHIVLQKYYIEGKDNGALFERAFKEKMKDVENFKYDGKMKGETNLRIVHNHKIGSSRVKVMDTNKKYNKFEDSLITYTAGRELIIPRENELIEPHRDYTSVKANININNIDTL